MNIIKKNTPPIPGFANLYLIPISDVLSFSLPIVKVANKDNFIYFEWAVDSLNCTQQTAEQIVGSKYKISFSGFIAGISDETTKGLRDAAERLFVVVAVDYNNVTFVAGNQHAPFHLKFIQDKQRNGYFITLAADTILPLYQANIVPHVNSVVVIVKTNPVIPKHLIFGAGTYMAGELVRIEVPYTIEVDGLGTMRLFKWVSYTLDLSIKSIKLVLGPPAVTSVSPDKDTVVEAIYI